MCAHAHMQMRLAKRLQDRGLPMPTVLVLRGGWQHWVRQYRGEADLVEEVCEATWGK